MWDASQTNSRNPENDPNAMHRCKFNLSWGTLIILRPACSMRRSAISCAATERCADSIRNDVRPIAFNASKVGKVRHASVHMRRHY